MKIKKAVIPVAGKGTRMLPVTKVVAKELIPLITKPTIHFVVEEALNSGIQEIIFVTSNGKEDIQKYFSRNIELEVFLERQGKFKELELIQNIGNMVDIISINQKEQLGLGHAILQTQKIINSESFAILLPDDLLMAAQPGIAQLLEISALYDHSSVIGLMNVPPDQTNKYGIVDGEFVDDKKLVYKIKSMIEKPLPENAPTQLAVPGRYIFTSEIFKYLNEIKQGVGGEYQLTDAINLMAKNSSVYGHILSGERFDTGNHIGLLDAILSVALSDPEIGKEAKEVLRRRLEK